MENNFASNPFGKVDVTDFFYNAQKEHQPTNKIEILTPKENALLNQMMEILKTAAPERMEIFKNRMKDLEYLSSALAKFPSLLERHDLAGGIRTPEILINSLVEHPDAGDPMLQLPSKATLGKGFLVAKTHTFSSLTKLAKKIEAPAQIIKELNDTTVTLMFSMLAEDVYLNLIRDKTLNINYRREWAHSLLLLWEHWTDQTVSLVAPVLQKMWNARRELAPTFGTMMGTSELLFMSIQMDERWIDFIKQKLGIEDFSQAMEEFLFGISYERIQKLRLILKTEGIPAIDHKEVSNFIGEDVVANAGMDYRDFYSLYTVRRDNARSRKNMDLPGPHKTIEEYFIQFIAEQSEE